MNELSDFWVGENGRLYDCKGEIVWGISEIGFLRGGILKLNESGIGRNWYPFP